MGLDDELQVSGDPWAGHIEAGPLGGPGPRRTAFQGSVQDAEPL